MIQNEALTGGTLSSSGTVTGGALVNRSNVIAGTISEASIEDGVINNSGDILPGDTSTSGIATAGTITTQGQLRAGIATEAVLNTGSILTRLSAVENETSDLKSYVGNIPSAASSDTVADYIQEAIVDADDIYVTNYELESRIVDKFDEQDCASYTDVYLYLRDH